ncbi:hypothetical protein HYS31_07080 [Candidatus Woesearchaeota archaeon]|nr:hypothetical protein [Candidatus Woesearchaeota archaeon]
MGIEDKLTSDTINRRHLLPKLIFLPQAFYSMAQKTLAQKPQYYTQLNFAEKGDVENVRFDLSGLIGKGKSEKDRKIAADYAAEMQDALKRIPIEARKIMNEYWLVVRITDGLLTDIPGYEKSGLEKPLFNRLMFDNIDGAFTGESILVKAGRDGRRSILEWYGRSFDVFFGATVNNGEIAYKPLSSQNEFQKPYKKYVDEWNKKDMPLDPLMAPEEFFAQCFAEYFLTGRARRELDEEMPLAGKYFSNLLEAVNAGKYGYLTSQEYLILQGKNVENLRKRFRPKAASP